MSKIDEIMSKLGYGRILPHTAIAEIKQAILEAVGEDEEIVIPKGWDSVSYDTEVSPRNQLRKEIKESIEKLFE